MLPTALELDFPTRLVSAAAEREAWRKEVHRPATHTHKWWAQRLGSVFRGILASALTASREEAEATFRSLTLHPEVTVLDPFAGSGTTLVEAVKMGCQVIGYDINPVATLVQRQALAKWDPNALAAAYREVEGRVRADIDALHVTEAGEPVLYYFWVSTAVCPSCPDEAPAVELFTRYVFAQHAYPRRYPTARATCPSCHAVVTVDLSAQDSFACSDCGWSGAFQGPVSGATMTCSAGHSTKVIEALNGQAPKQRMYAKLVLASDGTRRYEAISDFDLELYRRSEQLLGDNADKLVLPSGRLENGHNTRQAIKWGYKTWQQFFNSRQLYCLGLLGAAIRDLPQSPEREALAALFSGVLEFNNLFCSYKGEGTGAVRHMFSHHVLKPERVPLEAHPWGTPASSGSFSTLFKSRLLRALEYKESPYDLVETGRVSGISPSFGANLDACQEDGPDQSGRVLLSSSSSSHTALDDGIVDLVVTDPPYFDNVYYSELADFFHSWLREIRPYSSYPATFTTTRMPGEVQSADPSVFAKAIEAVWRECARVLKDDGLLAFTFHQARPAGWAAMVAALRNAGLVVTAIQPIKGEMSVAAPKSGAANPSNLDAIVVCRKASPGWAPTVADVVTKLRECQEAGVTVGWSDVQSVVRGTVMAAYTSPACTASIDQLMAEASDAAQQACDELGVVSRSPKGRS